MPIDAGADVTIRDEYGQTPLMRAAYNGCADMMKKILDDGYSKS
jgi:ankyrin repeat protein